MGVSTHSRPKAAVNINAVISAVSICFNTQPPEGGWEAVVSRCPCAIVSTHSRPKAADLRRRGLLRVCAFQHTAARRRLAACCFRRPVSYSFNTQPPEGGCYSKQMAYIFCPCFNTQPPEGGWHGFTIYQLRRPVSTHSRPKAADRRA